MPQVGAWGKRSEATPPVVGCPHTGDSQPGADRPRWAVADLFRLYGDTYRQRSEVSAAQLGGHAERRPQCGFARYAYSACRNRPCPTWQTWATAPWVAAQRAALLPTPYFHTVFPVSHDLNALMLGNTRLLLPLLFR